MWAHACKTPAASPLKRRPPASPPPESPAPKICRIDDEKIASLVQLAKKLPDDDSYKIHDTFEGNKLFVFVCKPEDEVLKEIKSAGFAVKTWRKNRRSRFGSKAGKNY